MSENIKNIKVGEEGYVVVINEKGVVVFHPNSAQIGQVLPIDEIRDAISSGPESGNVFYSYNKREK